MNYMELLYRQNMQNPYLTFSDALKLIDQRATHKEHLKANSVWLNPERVPFKDKDTEAVVKPLHIYVGEGDGSVPPWKVTKYPTAVMDIGKMRQSMIALSKGSISGDKAQWNHIYPEFVPEAHRFFRFLKTASAGAMTTGDFALIRDATVIGALVTTEEDTHSLDQAVNTLQSADIQVQIDTWNRFKIGGTDKGEFEGVDPIKGTFETASYMMRKAMGRLEWTDEHLMTRYKYNVMQQHVTNLVSAFREVKVDKIAADFLNTAIQLTAGGGNLIAFDAGTEHSTVNPYIEIPKMATEIKGNKGKGRTLAMSTTTFRYLNMNSWVKGMLTAVQGIGPLDATVVRGFPSLGGFIIYIDDSIPDGTWILIDASIAYFLQGPIKSENYRNPHTGVNGLYIRDWHKSFFTDYKKARKQTGLTT
jgi:hypothetical protein